MRGFVGLLIGVPLGAAAMYLVLRPPWAGHGTASGPIDAGVAVAGKPDGGVKPKKKPGGGGGHRPVHPTGGGSGDGEVEETEPVMPALTAADRALEWRGDSVARPAQTIDMNGGGAESRVLDSGEIDATINSQASGVRDCVVAKATNTDLSATITVQMLVDGTGRVTRSKVQAPKYLLDHGLLDCTQRALSRLKFPAVGGFTIVTLPVNLG